MSKLIIIRGNSGSGKTTIAKRLQHDLGYNTLLIPQDVVRREILRVKDGADNPAIQLIHDMAIYGKRLEYTVIIEGILFSKYYGGMLMQLINQFDSSFVYYLDIPFTETLRRHKTKPNSADFGEKEMREWYREKDLLGVKGEITIDHVASEDDILNIMLTGTQK